MKRAKILRAISVIMFALYIFTFQSCSKDITTDICANTACVNGLKTSNGSTCSCNCDAGYMGAKCDSLDPCVSLTCANGGTKVANSTSCHCDCPAGTFGATCSQTLNGIYLTSAGTYTTWIITNETANGSAGHYTDPIMSFARAIGTLNVIDISNFYGAGGTSTRLTVIDTLGTLSSGRDTFLYGSGSGSYKVFDYHGTLNAAKTLVTYEFIAQGNGATEVHNGTLVKQ